MSLSIRICIYKNLRIYLVNTKQLNGHRSGLSDNACQDFIVAFANVLDAKENVGSVKTTSTNTTLENFKQKWELFKKNYFIFVFNYIIFV